MIEIAALLAGLYMLWRYRQWCKSDRAVTFDSGKPRHPQRDLRGNIGGHKGPLYPAKPYPPRASKPTDPDEPNPALITLIEPERKEPR